MWTEHRNTEGRTYWFNTATKQSVWEKPDDLKTPFEKALKETKWREYFSQGRKYYYNTETKESKWDMPDELLLILEKVEKEGKANAIPTSSTAITGPESPGTTQGALVPMGGANQSSSASHSAQQNGLAVGPHTGGQLPLAASSILPARPNLPDDPVIPHNGFPTTEEAEKAFMHLFRKAGVDATWTWDQTMRAVITDPLYRALNTLAEKKACWEKYTNNLRAKEQEEKEARLAKLRPAIRNMLKGNPNVFHYTTFPTADKLFAQHPIWQQARFESERRMIFEEYIGELKQREMQESRASRARSVQKVMALFKQLNVDVVTRWKSAYQLVIESDDYRTDSELQKLPTLDVLLAFEDYSRVREREYEEQMRRAQVEKTRKERKAREAFKGTLQNLVKEGKITARSKWKEVYPFFRDDNRYLSMLGNPGSNPLELFWDVVDALDQQLDRKIAIVEEAFVRYGVEGAQDKSKPKGFVIGPETTEKEYNSVIMANADNSVRTLAEEDLREVYNTLHDIAVKKQADEKRRAERKLRHLQDDLRYAFKKLSEPLDISLSYEDIVPNIEHLAEYKALEDEDGRRAAWAKYVKRQKEKMREAPSEDGASTTSKKRKEPHRDERDRDKDDKGRDREREREREKDRERDKEKDRDYRDRDRERDREREREREKPRDYERDGRSSRHHHRYDDFDGHRSSRDYGRERDKDYEREKDRDGYRSHKHYREDDRKRERDGGHKERKSSRSDYGFTKDWDEPSKREEREKSASLYGDEPRDKHEDRHPDERAEKRAKLDRTDAQDDAMVVDKVSTSRAETPEEGEI